MEARGVYVNNVKMNIHGYIYLRNDTLTCTTYNNTSHLLQNNISYIYFNNLFSIRAMCYAPGNCRSASVTYCTRSSRPSNPTPLLKNEGLLTMLSVLFITLAFSPQRWKNYITLILKRWAIKYHTAAVSSSSPHFLHKKLLTCTPILLNCSWNSKR